MIMYWLAARRSTPTIFTDELEWTQLSRAIAATGPRRPARRADVVQVALRLPDRPVLVVALDSGRLPGDQVREHDGDGDRCDARVPAGPEAGLGPAACIAAVGALCTSAFFYAPLLLPEVLAYPTFCLCAYVSVRALSGDGRRWTAAAIVLSVVAPRGSQGARCAGAALALAAAVLWVAGPRSRRLRAGWSVRDHVGAAILLVGALVVLNAVLESAFERMVDGDPELAPTPMAARVRSRARHSRSGSRSCPSSPGLHRSGCLSDEGTRAGARSQRFSQHRSSRSGLTRR